MHTAIASLPLVRRYFLRQNPAYKQGSVSKGQFQTAGFAVTVRVTVNSVVMPETRRPEMDGCSAAANHKVVIAGEPACTAIANLQLFHNG